MGPFLLFSGITLAVVGVVFFVRYLDRRGWIGLRAIPSGVKSGLGAAGEVFDPPARHVKATEENRPPKTTPGEP